ncbi:Fcf2 pre-rRNA processing [Cooperia oncophora]
MIVSFWYSFIHPDLNNQVGRVVDAPQDFYSSRMTKKERKRTMLDELLNDQRLTQSKREKMFMVVIALLPKYKRVLTLHQRLEQ